VLLEARSRGMKRGFRKMENTSSMFSEHSFSLRFIFGEV
jgi:hypothetical protein